MADRSQRGNREARKPKKEKKVAAKGPITSMTGTAAKAEPKAWKQGPKKP
jgi:hypothetical protein